MPCCVPSLLHAAPLCNSHIPAGPPPGAAAAQAACAALLGLLFRLMGRTADDFFAVILSQISQDLGLPPRLAGVTLLALGNGAPDLSSCVAAVRAGNTRLALGALTGAGMFVGCVVAGRIVTANDGVRARAAQLRDILCFGAATAVVMGTGAGVRGRGCRGARGAREAAVGAPPDGCTARQQSCCCCRRLGGSLSRSPAPTSALQWRAATWGTRAWACC